METKTVYLFDASGVFAGACKVWESPLEPGVFIAPERSTDIAPPSLKEGEQALFANGAWSIQPVQPAPVPAPHIQTHEELIQTFKDAIQEELDSAARGKGYDSIISACSYAGYENVFQAEAIAFGKWRASVWAYGYAELAKVSNGERSMPTVKQIIAELPALVLP